jgi:hypothetical protein
MGQFVSDPYVLFVEICLSLLIYDIVRSLYRDGWGKTPLTWRGHEGSDDPLDG